MKRPVTVVWVSRTERRGLLETIGVRSVLVPVLAVVLSSATWLSAGLPLTVAAAPPIGDTDKFTQVSAGTDAGCAITTNQQLRCWGVTSLAPNLPGSFKQVSMGEGEACAVRKDGAAVCWGGLEAPPGDRFSSLSVGLGFACGLLVSHRLNCWGDPSGAETRPPPGLFDSVSSSEGSACAIRSDHRLLCWGTYLPLPVPSGQFDSVQMGSSWEGYACAERTDGATSCWGFDASLTATGFRQVISGYRYACGIKEQGSVSCWAVGGISVSSVLEPPKGRVLALSVGYSYACAVLQNETIACWGSNLAGEALGPEPRFQSVSVGQNISCGLELQGRIRCWGDEFLTPPSNEEFKAVSVGWDAECGLETSDAIACSGLPSPSASMHFLSVSTGYEYACGVATTHSAICWGMDTSGDTHAPAGQYRAVATGGGGGSYPNGGSYTAPEFSCGITLKYTITCWGDTQGLTVPKGEFDAIEVGGGYLCARQRSSGLVRCGDDDPTEPSTALSTFSTGFNWTCGLDGRGRILCWQFANNFEDDNLFDVGAPPAGRYLDVGVGSDACAVTRRHTVLCWNGDESFTVGA